MATAMTQPVQWFANPLSNSVESTPERQQPQLSSFRLSPFLGPAYQGQQQPWLTAPLARQAGSNAWQASQDSQLSSPLSVSINAGVGNMVSLYTPSPAPHASIAQLQPQFTHHENELYESSTDKQHMHLDEMQQNISNLKACLAREQDLRTKLQLRLVGANSTIKALRERALHSRMDAGLPPEELQYRQQLFNHQQHLMQLQETVGAAKKQLLQAEHEGTYQSRMTQEEHLSDADTLRPRKLLCSPGSSSAGCSPCPPMCNSKRPPRLVTTSNQYGCEQMPPKELISPGTDALGDVPQRVTSHFSLSPYLGTQIVGSSAATDQVMVFPQPVTAPSRASGSSPLRSTFNPFTAGGQLAAADMPGNASSASTHRCQPSDAGVPYVHLAGSHRGTPLLAAGRTLVQGAIDDIGVAHSGTMQQQRSVGSRGAATALHRSWQGDSDVGPLGRQVWRLLQLRSSAGGPSPSSGPCAYSLPGSCTQTDGRRAGAQYQSQDSACLAADTKRHGVPELQDEGSLVSRLMFHFAQGHGDEVPDLTVAQGLQQQQQAQDNVFAAGQQGTVVNPRDQIIRRSGGPGSSSPVGACLSLNANLKQQAGSPSSPSVTTAAVDARDVSCDVRASVTAQRCLQDLPGHVTRSAGTRNSSSSGASDSATTTPADVGASLSALVQRLDPTLNPSTVTPFISLRNKYGVAHSPYGQGAMAYQRICAAASEPVGVGLTSSAHLDHLPGPTPSAPIQTGTTAPAPTPTELQYVFEREGTGGTLAVLDAIQTWAEGAILQVRQQLSEEAQLERALYQASINQLTAGGSSQQVQQQEPSKSSPGMHGPCTEPSNVLSGSPQKPREIMGCQPAAMHSMQCSAQGMQPDHASLTGPGVVSMEVQTSMGADVMSTEAQTSYTSTCQAAVQTSRCSTSQAGVQTSQVVTTCVAAQTHTAKLSDACVQTSPPPCKQLSTTGVQAGCTEVYRHTRCISVQTSPVSSPNITKVPLPGSTAQQRAGTEVGNAAAQPPRSLFSLPGLCSAVDISITDITATTSAGCASSSAVAKVIAALNAASGPLPPSGLVRTVVAEPHKVAYKPAAFTAAAAPVAGLRASNTRLMQASGYTSPVHSQHITTTSGSSSEMLHNDLAQHDKHLEAAQRETLEMWMWNQTAGVDQSPSVGTEYSEDVHATSADPLQGRSTESPEQCVWKELATEFAAATPASLQRSAARQPADSYTPQSNTGAQDAAMLAATGECSGCWDGAAESPPTGALCMAASEANEDACEWADVAECDSVGVTRRDQRAGAGDSASKALALSMKSLQEVVGQGLNSPTSHAIRQTRGSHCSVDLASGRDQQYTEVQHSIDNYTVPAQQVNEISAFPSEGGLGPGAPTELLVGQHSMAGAYKEFATASLSGAQQEANLRPPLPDSPPQPRMRFGCFSFVRRSRQ